MDEKALKCLDMILISAHKVLKYVSICFSLFAVTVKGTFLGFVPLAQ